MVPFESELVAEHGILALESADLADDSLRQLFSFGHKLEVFFLEVQGVAVSLDDLVGIFVE